jgi:hypothetical protein
MKCPNCKKQTKFYELVREHDANTPKPFHISLIKEVKYSYSCPHCRAKVTPVEESKKWLLFLVPVALLEFIRYMASPIPLELFLMYVAIQIVLLISMVLFSIRKRIVIDE